MTNLAAFTKRDKSYPGYVSINRRDGGIEITVRGDATMEDNRVKCADSVSVLLSIDEWDRLLLDIIRNT